MTQNREKLLEDFLKTNKFTHYEIQKMPKDASNRAYYRLKNDSESFVLMDSPPESEDNKSFIKMADYLRSINLSAPSVIKADLENGFLLLQDFGTKSFTKVLNKTEQVDLEVSEEMLYERAIDALIHLHKQRDDINLPVYDTANMIKDVMLFIEWFASVINGEKISKKMQEEFKTIWKHLLEYTKQFGYAITLKDYHADNLMWLEDEIGIKKVGILDFQDAVICSPVYDIVSLLEDARRDVSPEVTEKMITKYLKSFPVYSRKDFMSSYCILGALRNLRIIGVFARHAAINKKPYYLSLLPRVWNHVKNDVRHPLLLPLKNWLNKAVPSQALDNLPFNNKKITV